MSKRIELDATDLPDAVELSDLWKRARETGEDFMLVREVGRTLMNHLTIFQDLEAQRQLQAQLRKRQAAREQADADFTAPPPKGYETVPMFAPDLHVPPEDLARYVKACEQRTGWGGPIAEFRQHRYQPEKIGYWTKRIRRNPDGRDSQNGPAADLWLEIVAQVNAQRANAAFQRETDDIEARNVRQEWVAVPKSSYLETEEPPGEKT